MSDPTTPPVDPRRVRPPKREPMTMPDSTGQTERRPRRLLWRIGQHGIHVYEGERPVATFHTVEDAKRAVAAYNEWLRSERGY